MASGFTGRTLDWLTLTVILRQRMADNDIQRLSLIFDQTEGWAAWLGPHEPPEITFYDRHDAALLALVVGESWVSG